MDIKISKLAKLTMPIFVAAALAACGSDDDSVTPPVTPPGVEIPNYPQEVTAPTANQVLVSVVDPDGATSRMGEAFTGWTLVPNASDSCDALSGDALSPSGADEFGPYWYLDSIASGACLSFSVADENGAEVLPVVEYTADDAANGEEVAFKKGETKALESRTEAYTGLKIARVKSYDPVGETEIAATNKAIVNFLDIEAVNGEVPADKYNGWTLHLWNNDTCDSLDAAAIPGYDDWNNTTNVIAGKDAAGPYWELPLTSEDGCVNYIVRDADNNNLTGSDMQLHFADFPDRTVTVVSGNSTSYDTRDEALGTLSSGITGRAAHWVDESTVLWEATGTGARLYVTNGKALETNEKGQLVGTFVELTAGDISDELKTKFPHLSSYKAYTVPDDVNPHGWVKEEIVAVLTDADGIIQSATVVQNAGLLDDLFYDDAKDVTLGAIAANGSTMFKLWAPTAKHVNLYLYDEDLSALGEESMVELEMDLFTGIWSANVEQDLVGKFYRYEVNVYHPLTRKWETTMVTDPYSLSLSTNSTHSQVVDLDADELKPDNWDEVAAPSINSPTEYVLYETHIRDFSSADEDGTAAYKGKYLAFTDTERASYKHLMELRDAGLNNVHLLPAFDIATVNEADAVDIDDTIGDLCASNANASVCGTENDTAVIKDVLASYDPATGDAQALMNDLRGLDSFNWGYDPYHYTVPEGSYATDANGTARILEFRQMVKHLHEQDMRVIMDVVYNHTNASGLNEKSVLDKIVPGYYHRLNASTGIVETSTCCDNTATENAMMGKLMTDSLVTWAEAYQIDGFRFDLMGHQPKDLMVAAWDAVKAVDPDNYFYGEGWDFGEVASDARFVQATQPNLGGTGIGSFSDRLRDAVRGGGPFDEKEAIRANQGFGNAAVWNELVESEDTATEKLLNDADLIRVGMAGNLKNFVLVDNKDTVTIGKRVDYNGQEAGYTEMAQENISYVSKHDNQTLWDNNNYKFATELSSSERARMQSVGLATVMYGQGIPFIHMGSELLRSKSMQRDSYDSGDWYNRVDFTGQDNNWNVGLPREDKDGANWPLIGQIIEDPSAKPSVADIALAKAQFMEMLTIRTGSPLFQLNAEADIKARVDFHNTGSQQTPGLIVMSIDDGASAGVDLDPNYDAMVVVVNASSEMQEFVIEGASGFTLHPTLADSADSVVLGSMFANATFTVPAMTTAVFVQEQGDSQGAGLKVSEKDTSGIPPYGDNELLLRGDMNEWGTSDVTEFKGSGVYSITKILEAGSYNFKFATADWSSVLVGCGNATIDSGSLPLVGDDNCTLEITETGSYSFSVNAEDDANPIIKVEAVADEKPFGDTVVALVGTVTDWAPGNADYAMEYAGLGKYTFTTNLTDVDISDNNGQFAVKVADPSWGSEGVNYGAETEGDPLTVGNSFALTGGDGAQNIGFATQNAGEYTFVFNAANKEAATLTVTYKEPIPVCEELAPSGETGPMGSTSLYVRGDLSDWTAQDAYKLSYKGNNTYQAFFAHAGGTAEFKIADDSSDWTTQFYVPTAEDNDAPKSGLVVDEFYTAWSKAGGAFSNNSMTFPAGNISVRFIVENAAASDAAAGKILIQKCE
ncbi:pullulanase [Agarivorans sp. Toyoura001]|uniref:pullulanase-type alpha-1,6-glucosidase n=1 Tax=Agarivorans sp. Toyoura001 TaxID=2283141 RepID=UPI0010E6E29F|nr:pullulanase-type alpha-1,6-glucosidase [Agarivorans sp. Toyoura001]GDY28125.1 pullulanase [Agarivorans sp. Toyoura001]